MKIIGWVLRGARYKDEVLEVGDRAIHGEEAFPEETLAVRTGGAFAMAGIEGHGGIDSPGAERSGSEESAPSGGGGA